MQQLASFHLASDFYDIRALIRKEVDLAVTYMHPHSAVRSLKDSKNKSVHLSWLCYLRQRNWLSFPYLFIILQNLCNMKGGEYAFQVLVLFHVRGDSISFLFNILF